MKNQNMHSAASRLGAIAACVLGLSASTAPAQKTSTGTTAGNEDEPVMLSPFVVEESKGYIAKRTMLGTRQAADVLDIPAAVTIITKDVLEDINATSIHEALNVGVSGFSRNQSAADDFSIRGFRLNGMLINGVARRNNGRLPLFGVERIEVIKGPTAMLIGNTQFLGGAVNVILAQPSPVYRGEASVTIGDHNYVQGSIGVAGPIVKGDNPDGFAMNYRVTLGYLKDDGFSATEWRDTKYYGGALGLKFGDRTSITFTGYYAPIRDYSYPSDFLDITNTEMRNGLPVARLNKYSTAEFAQARHDQVFGINNDTYVDMLLLHQFTHNTNFRMYYSYGCIRDFRQLVYGTTMQPDNVTYNRTRYILSNKRPWHTLQLDLLHKLERKDFTLSSMIGADGDHGQTLSNAGPGNPSPAQALAPIDVRNPVYGELSPDVNGWTIPQHGSFTQGQGYTRTGTAYFQENLALFRERLTLTGGLRWLTTGGYSHKILPTPVTTKNRNDNYKVHKYGILGRVLPGVSIYYTNAENIYIRTGFNDKVNRNDGLGGRQKNQEGILDEIGIKLDRSINDGLQVHGALTYFDLSLTNVVTEGPLESGEFGTVQTEKDNVKGWEVDCGITQKLGEGKFDVILTGFDAKGKTAVDPKLEPSGFSPRIFSILAKYTWTGTALKGLTLGGSFYDEAPKRWIQWSVDGAQYINLFASYLVNEHWSVQLNLNNIQDERYIVGVNNTASVDTAEPFRGMLTTRFRW